MPEAFKRLRQLAHDRARELVHGASDPFIPQLLLDPNVPIPEPGRREYENPGEWDKQLEDLYQYIYDKMRVLIVMDESHLRATVGRLACDLFLHGYRQTRKMERRETPPAAEENKTA